MRENEAGLAAGFRECGLKMTRQRAALMDVLENSEQPVSAEQVFLELQNKNIPVNLSTVYRILELLTCKGLAEKRTVTGDSKALYEYNRENHRHYLICLLCRKMQAIAPCPLGDYEKRVASETDFTITGHKMDIYGYCPECQKMRRENR